MQDNLYLSMPLPFYIMPLQLPFKLIMKYNHTYELFSMYCAIEFTLARLIYNIHIYLLITTQSCFSVIRVEWKLIFLNRWNMCNNNTCNKNPHYKGHKQREKLLCFHLCRSLCHKQSAKNCYNCMMRLCHYTYIIFK